MTLKLNEVFAVIKIHLRAKFYQAKCSSLSYCVNRGKNTNRKI